MRRVLLAAAGLGTTAAGATWLYVQPTYTSCPSKHEPISVEQCALMRSVGANGSPVMPAANPGARLFVQVLSEKQREELLQELQPIKANFGINLIQPVHAAVYR